MKKILITLLLLLGGLYIPTPTFAYCGSDADCPSKAYCDFDKAGSGNWTTIESVGFTGSGGTGVCDHTQTDPDRDSNGCVYKFQAAPAGNYLECCQNSNECNNNPVLGIINGEAKYCQGDNTIIASGGSCDPTNPLRNFQGCVYANTKIDPANSEACFRGEGKTVRALHKLPEPKAFEWVFGHIRPPKELEPLILKGKDSSVGALMAFLANIVRLIYFAAAVAFLFMIILGAWEWLTSGGDKGKIDGARKRITHAIIGIAILAFAFLFTRVVGNVLGFNFFGNL